jgi:hypothetical protein
MIAVLNSITLISGKKLRKMAGNGVKRIMHKIFVGQIASHRQCVLKQP